MAQEVKLRGSAIRTRLNRRKQLEADLEHVTKEMYVRNKELAETNRTLSLLRTIDTLVLESHESVQVLSQQICDAIGKSTSYPLVAILGQNQQLPSELELLGWTSSGLQGGTSSLTEITPHSNHRWFHSSAEGVFASMSRVSAKELAYYLELSEAKAEELKNQIPLKSIYLGKLITRQRIVGLLVVGSFEAEGVFKDGQEQLLNRLRQAVGIALDNKLLFEENQQVLRQLRKVNARLRELDKTKDEFISMASHQLRTPLTSVKGYLSMVLEGDVGPVTKNEKLYIRRAFDAAQRMVYLIADMLNVSRLQTGKFVIENIPTDLAEVVEAEIIQLKEQAEAKEIELIYQKPAKFPVLNLDETKIHQVIMNFLDNALYYTPSKGKITAELTSSPTEVVFKVTDTGIGVPPGVAHHLFSKFYRADNARKMRPDGTGLGLFMAKKVVVAQGGAIIFNSVEGKGSTFGFSFPRSGMEPKDGATAKSAPSAEQVHAKGPQKAKTEAKPIEAKA